MTKTVSPRILLAAALLLPLAVFAVTWATTWRMAQQGQDWLVPIRGYDPRDLLRGHYVQYQYDWPVETPSPAQVEAGQVAFEPSYAGALCIEGKAPNITRVREVGPSPAGCAIVARATLGTRSEVRGLESGILFASQARALDLSKKLADPKQQGLVRVRIRPDGVMRPIDLQFRPRAAQ